MTVKFTNNASTTVATGINTTATSLVVASAAGFPTLSGSGDYCYLTIQQAAGTNVEVVKATALSSNTFTVVRAQDGTSAGSWSASDLVELRVTAALLTDIVDTATHDSSVLSVDSTNARVGVNDTTPSVTLDISGTDAIALPAGTTAQRPTGVAGQFRYNSTLDQFEGFTDAWGAIGGAVGGSVMAADNFTANGSTTAFQLSQVVSSEDSLIIFIEGVFQQQDSFTIATAGGVTTVSFASAPANARSILIYSISAASLISGSNVNVTSMTGDGSDVTLTLPIAPVANNTQVFISGVYQNKDTYSVSGTTLTFSTAPPTGSEVQVLTLNQTAINVPVDNSITSAKLSGDLTTPGTLTSTGKITADAGIDIDNFNIDGTTIALSSGDLTLDVAGDIILDADGDEIFFKRGGVNNGRVLMADTVFSIGSTENNGDVKIIGIDGGSDITALTLDMSEAGAATFNSTVSATGLDINDSGTVYTGAGTGRGTIHLDPNSATDFAGNAITFGASDAGSGQTAQAGIYTRTDGSLGSEMHLSTTDSYSAGSKTGIKISNLGVVSVPRGYVSQSLVPAFNAYHNGSGISLTTALFPHNVVRYNNGGHFSTATYAFTAPVAGIYHFDFHTIYYGNGINAQIMLRKNTVAMPGTYGHFSNNQGTVWHTFNLNTTLALAVDDSVDVYVYGMGGMTYLHGDSWNEFSGFLVG